MASRDARFEYIITLLSREAILNLASRKAILNLASREAILNNIYGIIHIILLSGNKHDL